MADLIAKLPLASLALIFGTLFVLLSIMSQVSTKWFVITLTTIQRGLLACAGISLIAVALWPKEKLCEASSRCLPVVELPLVEKASAIALKDEDGDLFVRAREIHRYVGPSDTRRPYTEFEFGSKLGMLEKRIDIYPGQTYEIELNGRRFRVAYERSGRLDRPATDVNAKSIDVMLINIERIK
jgi:hypothetical protein